MAKPESGSPPPAGASLAATWDTFFALLEHHFFIYAMELVQSALLIRVPYYVTGKV